MSCELDREAVKMITLALSDTTLLTKATACSDPLPGGTLHVQRLT